MIIKSSYKKFLYIISVILIILSLLSVVTFETPFNPNNEIINNIFNITFTISAFLSIFLLMPMCVVLLIGTFFAKIRRFGEFLLCYVSMILSIATFAGAWFYILNVLAKGLDVF